jgi:hypothetical protein
MSDWLVFDIFSYLAYSLAYIFETVILSAQQRHIQRSTVASLLQVPGSLL